MRRANLPIQSLLLALLLAIPAGRSRAANEGELPDVPRLPPAAAPQVGFEGSALVGQPSDVARALAAPLKAALDVKAAPAASAQSGEELQRALQRPLAPVDGRLPYASVRAGLGLVSLLSGAVYSQPPAGPRLLHRLIEGLPSVQTVVSDYDDTLAFTHAPLSEEAVDAILGVLRAGKSFVIASNRQARVEPGDKLPAVLESLKPLRERLSELTDEQVRRLVVVTDGGGEIDRFDRSGEPRSVYEE
ncbi:MAG: hypothetical protein KGK30_08565, partial [Elusimicrobia bacterium]|nr:hypothetical protein [Elusimicrobiota bacterium]